MKKWDVRRLFHALGSILLFTLAPVAHSFDERPRLYLGAGFFSENMSRYATNPESDATSLTGQIYINLAVTGRFRLHSEWLYFSPLVTFTPFGVNSPDGAQKSQALTVAARALFNLGIVDLSVGPGILHKMVSATGGTVTLNNGTSESVFAFPSASVSMNLLYDDLGVGITILRFRLDADFLITDLLSSRRACDGMLTVSYGFI